MSRHSRTTATEYRILEQRRTHFGGTKALSGARRNHHDRRASSQRKGQAGNRSLEFPLTDRAFRAAVRDYSSVPRPAQSLFVSHERGVPAKRRAQPTPTRSPNERGPRTNELPRTRLTFLVPPGQSKPVIELVFWGIIGSRKRLIAGVHGSRPGPDRHSSADFLSTRKPEVGPRSEQIVPRLAAIAVAAFDRGVPLTYA